MGRSVSGYERRPMSGDTQGTTTTEATRLKEPMNHWWEGELGTLKKDLLDTEQSVDGLKDVVKGFREKTAPTSRQLARDTGAFCEDTERSLEKISEALDDLMGFIADTLDKAEEKEGAAADAAEAEAEEAMRRAEEGGEVTPAEMAQRARESAILEARTTTASLLREVLDGKPDATLREALEYLWATLCNRKDVAFTLDGLRPHIQ